MASQKKEPLDLKSSVFSIAQLEYEDIRKLDKVAKSGYQRGSSIPDDAARQESFISQGPFEAANSSAV